MEISVTIDGVVHELDQAVRHGEICYGTFAKDGEGNEYFKSALWHDHTTFTEGERQVKGYFVSEGDYSTTDLGRSVPTIARLIQDELRQRLNPQYMVPPLGMLEPAISAALSHFNTRGSEWKHAVRQACGAAGIDFSFDPEDAEATIKALIENEHQLTLAGNYLKVSEALIAELEHNWPKHRLQEAGTLDIAHALTTVVEKCFVPADAVQVEAQEEAPLYRPETDMSLPESGLYQHTDGGFYNVVGYTRLSETGGPAVIYQHVWPFAAEIWVRPLEEWHSRFSRVTEGVLHRMQDTYDGAAYRQIVSESKGQRKAKEQAAKADQPKKKERPMLAILDQRVIYEGDELYLMDNTRVTVMAPQNPALQLTLARDGQPFRNIDLFSNGRPLLSWEPTDQRQLRWEIEDDEDGHHSITTYTAKTALGLIQITLANEDGGTCYTLTKNPFPQKFAPSSSLAQIKRAAECAFFKLADALTEEVRCIGLKQEKERATAEAKTCKKVVVLVTRDQETVTLNAPYSEVSFDGWETGSHLSLMVITGPDFKNVTFGSHSGANPILSPSTRNVLTFRRVEEIDKGYYMTDCLTDIK